MINRFEDEPLDEFADQLRQCDPCRSVAPEFDPLARQGRQRWEELMSQRRQRLRRRRSTVIAMAAIVLCLGVYSVDRSFRVAKLAKGVDESANAETLDDFRYEIEPKSNIAKEVQPTEPSMQWFSDQLKRAGSPGDPSWEAVAAEFSRQPKVIQHRIVDWVFSIGTFEEQCRAMELVGDAAGLGERDLVVDWLQHDSTRSAAFSRALVLVQPDELYGLSSFAKSEHEKMMLCQKAWQSTDGAAADTLVQLAVVPQWRTAIRHSAMPVNEQWVMPLLMRLRQRNWETRTATAFVLASIPGKQFDETVATMVVQGRYRQPAYMALMSRDTPTAKAFLHHAARHTELASSLYSARVHFDVIEAKLIQWKHNSLGENHDVPQQNSRFKPNDTLGLYAMDGHRLDNPFRVAKHRG